MYLIVLFLGLSGCSVDNYDSSEDLITADAKGKAQIEESVLRFSPEEACAGELVEYCLTFPQATAGPNNKETNVLIDQKIVGDNPETEEVEEFYYVDIFRGKGYTEVCFDYSFETGINEIRYKTTGSLGSDWIADAVTIKSCVEVCAYGKGYWTNHGPVNPGNQEDMYPDGGILVGAVYYELSDLQDILQENGNTGEVFKMKQHLITVLLNIANGVDGSSMTDTISLANEIIIAEGVDYTLEEIDAVKNALEYFNESNACEETE